MDTAINGFHHVKLPVADLARSRDWYARVLGLQTRIEFTENGVLMGVAMRDPGGTIGLALRHDPARAAALDAWLQRLEDLGEPHGGIITGHAGRVLVGLHDPDGIEVRLYLPAETAQGADR